MLPNPLVKPITMYGVGPLWLFLRKVARAGGVDPDAPDSPVRLESLRIDNPRSYRDNWSDATVEYGKQFVMKESK